jgi:hypothetical protein
MPHEQPATFIAAMVGGPYDGVDLTVNISAITEEFFNGMGLPALDRQLTEDERELVEGGSVPGALNVPTSYFWYDRDPDSPVPTPGARVRYIYDRNHT